MEEITQTLVLECSSGEDDPAYIDTLTLRGMSLSSLSSSLSTSLPLLASLSLSHNNFHSLANFETLTGLRDLNLNFNKVTDVENLKGLKNLKSLYLSNNVLDDGSIR